jgi:hypothetical protein
MRATSSALLTLLYGTAYATSPGLTSLDNGQTLGTPSSVVLAIVDVDPGTTQAPNANLNATYIKKLDATYATLVNGASGTAGNISLDLGADNAFTPFLNHALKVNITAAYSRDDSKLTNFDASGAGYPAGSGLSFTDSVQWGFVTTGGAASDFTKYKLTEVYNTAGGTTQQGFITGWIANLDGALGSSATIVKTASAGVSWFDTNFGQGGPANPVARATLTGTGTISGHLFWVSNTDGNGVRNSTAEDIGNFSFNTANGQLGFAANHRPTGSVTIDKPSPTVGETLTATNDLADEDTITGAVTYQWNSNGNAITGQTSNTLVLGDTLVGKKISVTASYTDGLGKLERVTSAATAAVASNNQPPSGEVHISPSGSAVVGQNLTASNNLSDADGLGTISYQWKADGQNIPSATAGTYQVKQADVGKTITLVASYTDAKSKLETVTSADSVTVASGIAAAAATVDFGNVKVNKSAVVSVLITNQRPVAVKFSPFATVADPFKKVADTCSNKTIAPGKTCKVNYRFKPTEDGEKTVAAAVGEAGSIALSGTGSSQVADLVIAAGDTVDVGAGGFVTVSGSGFTTKGTVKIGGKVAKVVLWSDGQITVKAPKLVEGTYPVVVTAANKKTATANNRVKVNKPAGLVIGTVSTVGAKKVIAITGSFLGQAKPKVVFKSKVSASKKRVATVVLVTADSAITASLPTAWLGTDAYTVDVITTAGPGSVDYTP